MTRYRIRFLLHELDLPLGETLIGRSAGCQLTLDDPLISRTHARFIVTNEIATVEDLGSRNGVRVNGKLITGPTELGDGDRVRIGTQQFVVRCIAGGETKTRHVTGFLIHCTSCELPYPTELGACPHCGEGAAPLAEETTNTVQTAWNLELLVETLKRAESLGRGADIERLLLKAREEVRRSPELVDRRRIDQLAQAAVRLSIAKGDMEWARWALSLYSAHGLVPLGELSERLSELPETDRTTLAPAVDQVLKSARPENLRDPSEQEVIQTLRVLTRKTGASV